MIADQLLRGKSFQVTVWLSYRESKQGALSDCNFGATIGGYPQGCAIFQAFQPIRSAVYFQRSVNTFACFKAQQARRTLRALWVTNLAELLVRPPLATSIECVCSVGVPLAALVSPIPTREFE